MDESEQKIRNELLEHIKKWNDDFLAERHGLVGSVQIMARALLWGAAGVTASGITAVKRGMTVQRLDLEGRTQEEDDAFTSKYQEILDRLWSVVRDELREHYREHSGEEG